MPKLIKLNLSNMQNVSSGGGRANLVLPKGLTILGLLFLNSTGAAAQDWIGTETVRLLVNGRIITQATMNQIATVQDARMEAQAGGLYSLTGFGSGFSGNYTAARSVSWPGINGFNPVASATGRFSAFFLNLGQNNSDSPAWRRNLALNTGAPGITGASVEIDYGSTFTTPIFQVYAWVDTSRSSPNPDPSEVCPMIRVQSLACQTAGDNVFTDIPPYLYRALFFSGLSAASEGMRLLINRQEVYNTRDALCPATRLFVGQMLAQIEGIQGSASDGFAVNSAAGNAMRSVMTSYILDAAGNADNLFNRAEGNVELTLTTAAAKTVTLISESIGNPLTD